MVVFLMLLARLLGWAAPALPPRPHWRSPDGYVEYWGGTMPLLVSVPHGGHLYPAALPDRTCPGQTKADADTQELALALDSACQRRYGQHPTLVFCHLARRKLDVNRPLPEATCGNPQAAATWRTYHALLDSATLALAQPAGQRGLLLDLHGHAHPLPRIELGYLLTATELRRPDAQLPPLADSTGFWGLIARQPDGRASLPGLLRGPLALGTQLASQGLRAVPSQAEPAPLAGEFYFDGGYTCRRHGSRGTAGPVDAIQAETPYPGVRAPGARHRAGMVLAQVLGDYLRRYYHWQPGATR